MIDFVQVLKDSVDSSYNSRTRRTLESLLDSLDKNQDARDTLNVLITRSVENSYSKQEVMNELKILFERFPGLLQSIDNDDEIYGILYSRARSKLSGFECSIDERGAIIRTRIGSRGGFYYTLKSDIESQGESEVPSDQQLQSAIEEESQAEEKSHIVEAQFYPLVRKWAEENGYPKSVITGGKNPRPKWENPDVLYVEATAGKYTLSLDFTIVSFEVKLRIEPAGVWQAANYKKFSTWTYVAFAQDEKSIRDQDDGRVFEQAVELGIGVLALVRGETESFFKEIHSPSRNNPSLSEIEGLLESYSNVPEVSNIIKKSLNNIQCAMSIPIPPREIQ